MKTLATVALVACLPVVAAASGFEIEYPDNGAPALGRGGAFVARADDPSAIYYNPAGLTRLKGTNLMFSVNAISLSHTFDPEMESIRGGVGRREFESAEEDAGLFAAPMMIAQFDFESLPNFDFAVGLYGPATVGKRSFPNQWQTSAAYRVSSGSDLSTDAGAVAIAPNGIVVETELLQAYPTLAVGYQLNDAWRFGVSLQTVYFHGKIKKAIGGATPSLIDLDVTDSFTPTGVVGVQYVPSPNFELGLSVRPSFRIEAEGTVEATLFNLEGGAQPYPTAGELPFYDANGQPEDGVDFSFENPMVVRLGGRYVSRVGGEERWDIELDYIYSRQSIMEMYETKFHAVTTDLPLDGGGFIKDVTLPAIDDRRDYVDTHGVRLGGDYKVNDLLVVRAGGTYETGASPDEQTNLDFPGLDQWSVSAGAGLNFGMVTVDLGYTYVGLVEREVTNSEVPLIDITLSPEDWTPTGDGTFSGHYHVLGLSTIVSL